MKLRFTLIVLSICIVFISNAGGGWLNKKNEGYFKLGQYVLRANMYYNPEGDRIKVNPGISVYTTSLYFEYGLTDKLTAIGYLPFYSRSVLNALQRRNGDFVEGDKLTSFGDNDISLKYGLIQDKPIVVSAKLTFGLPLGNQRGGRTETLQTGDGEFNQMLTIEASRSFYPVPLYVSTAVGFNNRTNGFSDEFRYGLEVGYTMNKITALTRISGVESLMNGSSNPNSIQGVFGNNIEYLTIAPEVIYSVKENFGFSLSIATAISGRQVLANPAYEVGFFFKI